MLCQQSLPKSTMSANHTCFYDTRFVIHLKTCFSSLNCVICLLFLSLILSFTKKSKAHLKEINAVLRDSLTDTVNYRTLCNSLSHVQGMRKDYVCSWQWTNIPQNTGKNLSLEQDCVIPTFNSMQGKKQFLKLSCWIQKSHGRKIRGIWNCV